MLYPSINDLLKKVDSRYTLVMMASKRARQLVDGDKPSVDSKSSKPVSIAIHEISDNKIGYTRAPKENMGPEEDTNSIENIENVDYAESIEDN